MSADEVLPPGKLPAALLATLLAQDVPLPADVIVGPGVGEDGCALVVPAGVLAVVTDPITFSGPQPGRSAVIVNANDLACMGVRPRWFLAAALFPVGTTEAEVALTFADMRAALGSLGATLVGGHTEITRAVHQPVIVGQMLGTTDRRACLSSAGVRPGHVVVQVGRAPVEGPAVLAAEMPARLAGVDPDLVRAAASGLGDPGISIVEAALQAADLGATALHDPTEGGLAGALHELATAAGVRLRVDRAEVLWFEPGVAVCHALGADPWATLASGTLLAAFEPGQSVVALRRLRRAGHTAAIMATAESGSGVVDRDGHAIDFPARDEVARILGDG